MLAAVQAHAKPTPVTNPQALRREIEANLRQLASEVDAAHRDRGFQEALRTMERFWRYSLFNQFLIRWQHPRATRLAGRKVWESLGRHVKPEAQPIKILAPSFRAGGQVLFHEVEVFDVRQTAGRRLASVSLQLKGRTRHAQTLEKAATRLGIVVAHVALRPGLVGRSMGGRVEIQKGLPEREVAATLVHELAHELLHQGERSRFAQLLRPGPRPTHAERETEADATAYVVLAALGLPSKAPRYIAWQGGTGQVVLRSLRRVQQAARRILEVVEEGDLAPRRVVRDS